MHARIRFLLLTGLGAALLATAVRSGGEEGQTQPAAGAPVVQFDGDTPIVEWLVLGPFPNPPEPATDAEARHRQGFNTDYLKALGGEADASIAADTRVTLADGSVAAALRVAGDAAGEVTLSDHYDAKNQVTTYAFAYVDCPTDQEAHGWFGSNDSAKVWVGGKLVHEVWTGDRGVIHGQDRFDLRLKPGRNPVLIKIENGAYGWGFALRILDDAARAKLLAIEERRERLEILQDAGLQPEPDWKWMGAPGDFPAIVWQQPKVVKLAVGEVPLKVRWFDADLNEVKKAEKPGRYVAYIAGATADSVIVRRFLTYFCHPDEYQPWLSPPQVSLQYAPYYGVDAATWTAHQALINAAATQMLAEELQRKEHGVAWLAGLSQLSANTPLSPLNDPRILNHDHQLRLKLKILGLEGKLPPLRRPQSIADHPAPVLHQGRPEEAGVTTDFSAKLQERCQQWYEETKTPFVILVARHGVIAHHAAYGESGGQPVTRDARMEIASISKSLTGLMFAQFLDQGLLDLDDPVGKILPDLPTQGPHAITFRQCFTHTAGLDGHGRWGGMDNAWLDNVIAHNVEVLQAGKRCWYDGMGPDLIGKALEVAGSKSVFRLMEENFFAPLGCQNVSMEDMAFGTKIRALDLAKMGQLVLNGGAYGDTRFFSEATTKKLLPVRLRDYFPDYKPVADWQVSLGVGLTGTAHSGWRRTPKAGEKEGQPILSPRAIGHGSGSGAFFMVDFATDLVIAMVRDDRGADYQRYATGVLETIVDNLAD